MQKLGDDKQFNNAKDTGSAKKNRDGKPASGFNHVQGKQQALIDSTITINEAISTVGTIKKTWVGTGQINSTRNLNPPDSESNARRKIFGNGVQPKPTFDWNYLNVRNHWATKYVNRTDATEKNKRQLEESVSSDSKKSRISNSEGGACICPFCLQSFRNTEMCNHLDKCLVTDDKSGDKLVLFKAFSENF